MLNIFKKIKFCNVGLCVFVFESMQWVAGDANIFSSTFFTQYYVKAIPDDSPFYSFYIEGRSRPFETSSTLTNARQKIYHPNE